MFSLMARNRRRRYNRSRSPPSRYERYTGRRRSRSISPSTSSRSYSPDRRSVSTLRRSVSPVRQVDSVLPPTKKRKPNNELPQQFNWLEEIKKENFVNKEFIEWLEKMYPKSIH